MNAGIITIGTELLIGSVLDTNSKYLSEKLSEIGVHVSYQLSLRDDFIELSTQIKYLLGKVDILFLCGGLGPTEDDITKEALAEVIDKKLVLDEYQYKKMLDRFSKLKKIMSPNNKKQAYVIEGSKVLDNKWGTAPGEVIEYNDKKIFLFPGPPKEFEPMINYYLKSNIKENNGIVLKSLNITGLGESTIEEIIRNLNLEKEHISINTFAHFYDTEIKIIAEGLDEHSLNVEVNNIVSKLYSTFGNFLYSEGEVKPKEALVRKLIEKNLTIGFAESITGGLLSSKLTSVKNASKVLKNSIISYSNESKVQVLKVSEDTLNNFGAVSYETSIEMAEGLYNMGLCDIAVSITGEAGPNPSEKEIGTVFVCYYYKNYFEVKEYLFSGNRTEIQERAADAVITHLLLNIDKEGE
ncbi:competence/damage-inducible protein A [Anaerosphaera multitolerans]|uniref:Putative competence-damage inducible protein n=1 Tax=Anaerosphaera multitolerans TaxID=2487351 RepID=A0A437S592_9FIRM|nr:competence/damage-inducible protein A [Anaerosphaera multitolerans]RVU54164.1 competence/damage-inducible protein A [Anaerosphaera multitolerans]